ncbi:FecR domain-containing protein [Rhodothermus marinus]|uniref:FecR domain-containing protein n=1 Tax=Rhodothermus marinus TaxID=29549 RepID=UPI0012BA401D|nr:FecR domain-containing protein [Rhodothermus marinus]BBM69272.1 anti-sigma factor [Rhodothermus marinus]BBM72264.1 anti-sigma factor [Rhodothermus marinus]
MHEGIDWDLLAKYIAGACSEAERAAVEAWASADPMHRQLLEELRLTWQVMEQMPPPVSVETAWQRVRAQMERPADRPAIPARRHQARAWGVRVLAVLAVTLGVALLYHELGWLPRPESAHESEAPRVFVTQRGQRATVQLVDGTRILLAPESRLEVAADYGRTGRHVTLAGEAYFEVASDSLHPFVVQAPRLRVQVLGTAFGVRAYAEETRAYVAVRHGRVQVQPESAHAETAAALLEAGQVARLKEAGRLEIRRPASLDAYVGWAEGRLVFERTPLREVARTLARWYDLEIQLDDPALGARQLTATFEEAPAYQVLQIIAATMNLEVVRDAENPRRIRWREASPPS